MTTFSDKPLEVRGFYLPVDRSTDYSGEVVDPKTGELVRHPSMTKQEFVAECDINNIIKEYTQTGQVSHMSARASQGTYEDLPAAYDFQEAMNTVLAAQEAFATLPSGVRSRFQNDPEQFLEFFSNPDNTEEAIRMGLANARPEASPPVTGATGGDGGTPPSEGAKAP